MFGRGEFLQKKRVASVVWCHLSSPLLSHQVANHVVQALLNQKVNLPFCHLA